MDPKKHHKKGGRPATEATKQMGMPHGADARAHEAGAADDTDAGGETGGDDDSAAAGQPRREARPTPVEAELDDDAQLDDDPAADGSVMGNYLKAGQSSTVFIPRPLARRPAMLSKRSGCWACSRRRAPTGVSGRRARAWSARSSASSTASLRITATSRSGCLTTAVGRRGDTAVCRMRERREGGCAWLPDGALRATHLRHEESLFRRVATLHLPRDL